MDTTKTLLLQNNTKNDWIEWIYLVLKNKGYYFSFGIDSQENLLFELPHVFKLQNVSSGIE